jgi:hypothetical protein
MIELEKTAKFSLEYTNLSAVDSWLTESVSSDKVRLARGAGDTPLVNVVLRHRDIHF